ncbi:hypothetical protein GCK72_015494 [Caenorhabditis remanei]|uniref:RING-type domain-containing protein n=1 Tax=Caenorhabditis remanei TaxID=31234 RepID=A0A6A5GWM4_CAERE|nr:hypothetical protein GCK72_015494 [Caenorhabditis remanei]KAF1759034.1 hypothetical protein GCK72_015494 [Caenorhabditis remanei]
MSTNLGRFELQWPQRAVMEGYGGGRGIHAVMAGVQCMVCLQEFTGPQGNRVPKLLLCGHTFCARCIDSLTEWNRARCPSCRAVTENADTAIHNNFVLFNNQ